MHALRRPATLVFLLASSLVAPAQAQDYAGAVGYGGGGVWFGDFNEGTGGQTLALDPGWIVSAHAERWLGSGRFGARANTAFTSRPLEIAADVRNINTWLFNADLVLRVLPAREGRLASPFLAVGAGVVSYGLGEGPPVVLPAERAVFPGDTERRFAGTVGAGLDIFPRLRWLGTPIGFRLEAGDHIVFESPFRSLEGGEIGPVHNYRVTLGVLGLVELLR